MFFCFSLRSLAYLSFSSFSFASRFFASASSRANISSYFCMKSNANTSPFFDRYKSSFISVTVFSKSHEKLSGVFNISIENAFREGYELPSKVKIIRFVGENVTAILISLFSNDPFSVPKSSRIISTTFSSSSLTSLSSSPRRTLSLYIAFNASISSRISLKFCKHSMSFISDDE